MAYERVYQPIFQPLRKTYKVFGIPAMTLLAIVGVCIVGFAAAYMLGNVKVAGYRPLTNAEAAAYVSELREDQEVLQKVEAQREALGIQGYAALSLTEEQQEALERCAKEGIFADSTEADLAELVPPRVEEERELVPAVWRYLLLIGLPALVGCALFMEINRTSLYREARRAIAFSRSQKRYRNLPMTYVERETGRSYWEAVLEGGDEGQEQ